MIRVVDGVECESSSGNVFADLGLPDAEKLKIKSGLVIRIRKTIRDLDLTRQEAAQRMGITQQQAASMLRGDFDVWSEEQIMSFLERLGGARQP
ncbi:MAG: helix-turn-helix domain-containing protein [Acidobacteriaceae bacterium]